MTTMKNNSTAGVEETKMFKYYLKSNRPIFGAVPSGYVNAEKFDNAVRVPRKGYVYGVATYDKPLTAKQIVNYDLRPEDDSEIEKVNNYSANCILINCLDDYFVNSDDAAEVEEVNAENDSAAAEIEEDGSSYDCEAKVVTITESKIKAAVAEYNSIGEHFDDIMDVAVDEDLPNWEREQNKLIRKHYAAECKAKTKFLRNFFAEIGVPKKILKIKVSYDYSEFMGTVDYCIEISPKTEKIDAEQLGKIAGYFVNRNTAADVSDFDFYDDDVLDDDEAEIKIEIVPENTPDDMAEVADGAKEKTLAEKVAEIKNRPRKSVVDWTDAIFQNVTVPEIFKAQKFLKKYLKLGQLDLAENIFAMLKTLCRNYRVAA